MPVEKCLNPSLKISHLAVVVPFDISFACSALQEFVLALDFTSGEFPLP